MPLNYLAASSLSVTDTISWTVGILIVVGGLLVLGARDLLRFSLGRVWAISGVAFDESIRRRVLWIIPLAVLGIIAVVQFQRAPDPQDAIRQSTKICLFATGVVVMVTTVILSCTSLPKEIDNRVIFTIVTKPTTRLEIVLGKIVGFARVSGLILVIMGLFTIGFLKLQEARLLSINNARLQDPGLDPAGRPLMEYYKSEGLLATKSMEMPVATQVLARPPSGAFNEATRILGNQSQYFAVVFELSEAQREQLKSAVEGGGAVYFEANYGVEHREPTAEEAKELKELKLPTAAAQPAAPGLPGLPGLPGAPLADAVPGRPVAQVVMHVMSLRGQQLVDDKDIGSPAYLKAQYELQQQQEQSGIVSSRKTAAADPNLSPDPDGVTRAYLSVPRGVQVVYETPRFEVRVYGVTPATEYLVGPRPLKMIVSDGAHNQVMALDSSPRPAPPKGSSPLEATPVGPDPAAPVFLANTGRYGLQILGRADGKGAVAGYHFSEAKTPQADADGQVSVEVRIGLEGSSMDYDSEGDSVVRMSMQVRNANTGKISDPIGFVPENNRVTPVRVPAEYVQGGKFDVYVRALTEGQYFGLGSTGVTLVTAERSFTFNLVKSLLTLWMMAILVIAVGVFCSTWLSWPIAIVLTLMMLLGRWGVSQIGDSSAGLGAEVTQSLSLDDPTGARIVRTSVNALQTFLSVVAAFLPDISQFSVTEDIERGISIPPEKMLQGLSVLLFYGVPVTVLGYVFLKKKEVAP